jgi:hypothetical protein
MLPAAFLLDSKPFTALTAALVVVWQAARERVERAEREREREDMLARLESSERRLLGRVGRVLSEEAFLRAHRCVFALSWTRTGAAHGVGVLCGAPGVAVTAAHNLTERRSVTHVFGKVYPFVEDTESTVTVLAFEIVKVNCELDFAVLRVVTPLTYRHFLECCMWPGGSVRGNAPLALCAFQLATQEDLPEFGVGLGVMTSSAVRLSPNLRHLLYQCTTYAGDSGAALLLYDGQLVGMHLDFVNALRESLDRKTSVNCRLSDVEQSLAALVAGAGQGTSVALLASQFDFEDLGRGVGTTRERKRR